MRRQEPEGQQQGADALREQLRWLEGCFDSNGPFFMGEQFSVVDISILPLLPAPPSSEPLQSLCSARGAL